MQKSTPLEREQQLLMMMHDTLTVYTEAVEEDNFPGAGWEEQRRARTLIKFAFEGDVDKPGGRLSRAPTPYPKELKALARHARNLSALQKDPQRNQFVQQKDPTRQGAPVRGLAEQNSGVGGQAGVTSPVSMKVSTDDTDKVSRDSLNIKRVSVLEK